MVSLSSVEARMDSFIARVKSKSALVGVIGQGYVGLPLALVFAEAGFRTIGFDVDADKIAALRRGESYIRHLGADRVAAAAGSARFLATDDFKHLRECDAILICVPTPLGKHREPDNSYIHATAREIARHLRPGQLVVLESTTYPGTTEEEVLPILTEGGLASPGDFLLAFSPEREDPGNAEFSTRTIPKVVGGINPESTAAAVALYQAGLERVVPVSSARVAESCKLLENVFRSVNIALVNELKRTFCRMGIDVWEVIAAASTKPFGFMPFYPGPGLGGHCIPLDPFYLSWKAAEHGMWARFIELAGEINTEMPRYVVSRLVEGLNDAGRPLRGSRVLVAGLSYKANVDDTRESPSFELIELLRAGGAEVAYCDPHFPEAPRTRKHDLDMKSVPCTPEAFAAFDAVLLATAHDRFKDPRLWSGLGLVVDTRNLVQPLFADNPAAGPKRLVKA
ncbi:MAG: nucleotide sugar dehydrogenase [Deltaproteobacteria bacterium]|nr:nucleotide sugar dehydrogenase [Deltaproteobacteria bacterium]